METQVWARNPLKCVREAFEVGITNLVWDASFLLAKDIYPDSYILDQCGAGADYLNLVVGEEWASLYLPMMHDKQKPSATWPVWTPDSPGGMDYLEELLAHPVAQDEELCASLPATQRPKKDQPNLVVIDHLPDLGTTLGRRVVYLLNEVQKGHPHAALHIHGSYSWRTLFGLTFPSVDFEFFEGARKGTVFLPNGRMLKGLSKDQSAAKRHQKWVELCGHEISSLAIPRERCLYQMRAAQWAAKHYKENVNFRVSGKEDPDPDDPNSPPSDGHDETASRLSRDRAGMVEGDKFLCDVCSVQSTCKYFRSGGVCSIPDTEPARLANLFQTRDADTIVTALGTLLSTHSNRLERALEEETALGGNDGPLDPEVTKLINSVFDRGVELAKLLNPELRAPRGRPVTVGVQVNNGSAAGAVAGATPQAAVAAVYAELEGRGISRDQITPEMVAGLLTQRASAVDVAALPGVVVE
jgi:hypothetical protein